MHPFSPEIKTSIAHELLLYQVLTQENVMLKVKFVAYLYCVCIWGLFINGIYILSNNNKIK